MYDQTEVRRGNRGREKKGGGYISEGRACVTREG